MSIINTNAKEIHCKILYCGPQHSGKKSSLLCIRDQFEEGKRDFFILPFQKEIYCLVLSIGPVFACQTFFHIYNLNNESRQDNENLLRGLDGIVFVASQDLRAREKNIQSFSEMVSILKADGRNLFHTPLVLQYNKKDLAETQSIKDLRMDLNRYNNKDFESSALKGQGVLEPLKHVCKRILNNLKQVN